MLGVRVGWQQGEAAVPWECVWLSLDEQRGRDKREMPPWSTAFSGQQGLRSRGWHCSSALGAYKSEKEKNRQQIYFVFLKFSSFSSNI